MAPGNPTRLESRLASPQEGAIDRRATWVPAAFILFSLFALLLGPMLFSARTESLREAIVEPGHEARGAINDIRHAMTSGEAAVRGILLTGDRRFVDALRDAQEEERRAFRTLIPLARQIDPDIARQVESLQARSEAAVEARSAIFQELMEGHFPAELLAREDERHEALIRESDLVKNAILARTTAARAKVQRTRQLGTSLTVALALLALVAALVVLRTGRAHRLRAQEEAELRAAAFSLTEATEVGEVLRRIAGIAARTRRGESSYVERIDVEAGEVEVVASVGESAPPVGARIPYPGSLTEEAVEAGEPETVRDLGRQSRPVARVLPESCQRCVALVLPLVADEETVGGLVIIRGAGARFDQREVEQRRALGILAALSLRKSVLLEKAREQHHALQRITRSRERLMRGFSHDLKNPLGAADGHAQLLADGILGDLSERQRESVQRIRSGIGSALELIGSLIELARSEAGKIDLDFQAMDIAAIVRQVAHQYEGLADAEGLEIRTAVEASIPQVRSDRERVRQILGNLLSNAIKYTPRGGTVRLEAKDRTGRRMGDPSRWVTVVVQDSGPGIAEEEQDALFTEFSRLDPGATKGEGLGLAISDRVARLLGGEITVDSKVGTGSTFTLWLPANPGPRVGPPDPPAARP
jgi:signal transduction histidine kinase/CHASE3 domain sensor protein